MSATEDMLNAVKNGDVGAVKRLLAADGALVNAKDADGSSATLVACYWGKTEVRNVLLAHHPHLNIFEAAAAGAGKRVEQLLAEDAELVRGWSGDGFTALHLAVFFGHTDVALALMAHGADVGAVSRNPMMVQPLHSAAAGNHIDICRALVERGADVNAVQQDGFTPLMSAAQNGNLELVQFFLTHGAERGAVATGGKTARDFAAEKGHDVVATLLG